MEFTQSFAGAEARTRNPASLPGMLGEWMESELREQAVVLPREVARYRAEAKALLDGRTFDLVVLTARGSSDHAALFARYLIEIHLGIPVSLAAPSVITQFGGSIRYPERTLGIGISQSGAAPDVAEVLHHLADAGHATLAITNTPDSRMTHVAEGSMLLGVGPEQSIAATKTFTSSLLALLALIEAMGGPELDEVALDAAEAWVANAFEFAERVASQLIAASPLIVLGRGYAYPIALETALKLMECALIPAKAFSSADFEHGPRAVAGLEAALLVVNPLSAPKGLPSLHVDWPVFETSAELAAVPQAIVGQALALEMARLRRLDPDHAPRLRKVTETN